jgi:hypothetical protein
MNYTDWRGSLWLFSFFAYLVAFESIDDVHQTSFKLVEAATI